MTWEANIREHQPHQQRRSAAISDTLDGIVRCVWCVDNDGVWNTDCGQVHVFIDGTPGQNGFGFCPYCGKPMAEIHTPNGKDERSDED